MARAAKILVTVAMCLAAKGSLPAQGTPSKYALLIEIDKYQHSPAEIRYPDASVPREGRYAGNLTYPDLTGPPNDVDALRKLLIDKFHFLADPGHMVVLRNEQAKHDLMMKALQTYLVDKPKKGDTVLLYVSSHGSLRIYGKGQGDPKSAFYNLLDDENDQRHAENTLVPFDWNDGADDIFSRDLRHFYRQAVDNGIHVTAIFDSCHSGDLGRGLLGAKLVSRDFDFDRREMEANPYAKEEQPTLPQDDPVNPVLILSAAQKDQLAIDDGTLSPAHGLFTAALLEALAALPEDSPASDVFNRLQVTMELAPNSRHQQPELDTRQERMRQPLFGGTAATGHTTAAVVASGTDGVLLDIGIAADIGPGSVFATTPRDQGTPVLLQVTESDGLGRSKARILPPGGTVTPPELVELKQAMPWKRPVLLLYAGASNPGGAEVKEAIAAVTAAALKLAADPSQDPWSFHVYWDGSHWALVPHSKPANGGRPPTVTATDLGAHLSVKALGRLPVGSSIWFDPPLPRETVQALLPPPAKGEAPLAAQLTLDRSQAMYVTGARLNGSTLSYAWFKRSDVDDEVQTPGWMGPGCSPGSSFPLHTEWIPQPTGDGLADAMTQYAGRMAKLNGWLQLQSSPWSKHEQFPFTLTLRPAGGGQDVGHNGTTSPGDYDLYLVGRPTAETQPRWVYVLSIDCQGNGSVVWPYTVPPDHPEKKSQPAAKFPTDDANKLARSIRLPGESFPVQPPFGTDTYLLLTTATRLSDYHALEFERVVTRGLTGNPLEDLLDSTSGGTREVSPPVPTDWSVWEMRVESRPEGAARTP